MEKNIVTMAMLLALLVAPVHSANKTKPVSWLKAGETITVVVNPELGLPIIPFNDANPLAIECYWISNPFWYSSTK
jgi:hypothetical protein